MDVYTLGRTFSIKAIKSNLHCQLRMALLLGSSSSPSPSPLCLLYCTCPILTTPLIVQPIKKILLGNHFRAHQGLVWALLQVWEGSMTTDELLELR